MMISVVGGGIFGLTAALELRARGHAVTVHDPGPIPHPLAESTDISKVVRVDYGDDADYTALGEAALAGWRRWNAQWPAPLFHESGVMFLSREPMHDRNSFEHASYTLLTSRGHALERLDAAAISRRFPAYQPGALVDGYWNPQGGWAAAGAVVRQLAADAVAAGVVIETRAVEDLDALHELAPALELLLHVAADLAGPDERLQDGEPAAEQGAECPAQDLAHGERLVR